MTGIVGRDAELLAGDRFARAVNEGPAVLLLEGDAGIGKTTVWAAIAERAEASGMTVLRAQPAAAERSLTLSAIGDLLERVPDVDIERLPSAQRRAIDAALLRGQPADEPLAQRLLAVAVRSLLLELSTAAPLVLAVDDVQWLDPASASTLGYALRRVGGSRVGLLAALRPGVPVLFDPRAMPPSVDRSELRIGPLSLAALHHLLKDRLGHPPARSTLVRIHEASRGNPLFALEIVRLLREIGEPAAREPLPVPDDLRELVRRRVIRLPRATREVLLAVSASGATSPATIGAALGRDIATDLELAEHEEVLRVDGEAITFCHPLFDAAIYSSASQVQRREVHRRLAATVEGLEERARHRALAATRRSAEVAGELEQAARAASARAAPLAAADLLRLAIRSTPGDQPAAKDDRTIELGRCLQRAGDTAGAQRVLDEAVRTASSRRIKARARLALANVLFDLDAGPRCGRLAAEAIPDAEGDPELVVYAHAMLAAVEYSDRQVAAWHAREARRLLVDAVHPSPAIESLVLYVYVGIEVQEGKPLPMDLVDRALALERIAPAPNVSDRLSASLGYWLMVADDLAGGRRWMEATYAAAVDEGDDGSVPYALSHLPLLEFAAGDWARAEDLAKRHLAAAEELGQGSQRLEALFNVANVLVHQGREAEARPLIEELLRDAEAAGSLWDLTKGLAALGALELSLGDAVSAAGHLLRAEEGRDALGDDAPRRHEADLVESLVMGGHIDRARTVVVAVDERARRYGRHSRLALAARCRALVAAATGQLDEATTVLDEALAEHDLVSLPFDRARTELVLGQVRRRRRERSLAKAAFESALATFERLGARLWADRTRVELGRVGLRRGPGDALTEGERRVAELVASGRTIREVAATLFLSPRTVETNLAHAYRKLGVGSRAELGAVMAGVPGSGTSDRRAGARPRRNGGKRRQRARPTATKVREHRMRLGTPRH